MTDGSFSNLAMTLSVEFQKYLMRHPELADKIPAGAVVVFQLDGEPEFNEWSKSLAAEKAAAGMKTVAVRVGAMTPPVSRIERAELLSA